MKGGKGWIIGGLVFLALAVVAMILSFAETVEVVQADRGVLTLLLEESAYVQTADERELQATSIAQVEELLVAIGDKVRPGQLLIRLSSPELAAETAIARSQLTQAEAELQTAGINLQSLNSELKQAEKDLERQKSLLQSGALAQAEYEEYELAVDKVRKASSQQESGIEALKKQQASLGEMLKNLEDKQGQLQVSSPLAGSVLDLPVKVGQVVAPGSLLAQLGSTVQLEVKAEILSDELRRLKPGQNVQISAPVLGDEILHGQVTKIYPQAYERTSALGVIQRRVPIIISLQESANLQPGYEVRAAIEILRKEGVILLPRETLRLDEKGNYRVWLVDKGRSEQRVVQIGERNQQWAEITKGIEKGDIVVRDGSLELKEGGRVRTSKTDPAVRR